MHVLDVDQLGGMPVDALQMMLKRYARSAVVFSAVDGCTLVPANIAGIQSLCAETNSTSIMLLDRVDIMQIPPGRWAWADYTIVANPNGGTLVVGDSQVLQAGKWTSPKWVTISSLNRQLDVNKYARNSDSANAFRLTMEKIMPVATANEFAANYYQQYVRLTAVVIGWVNNHIAVSFVSTKTSKPIALPIKIASKPTFPQGCMHPQLKQNMHIINLTTTENMSATVLEIVKTVMQSYPMLKEEARSWQAPKAVSAKNRDKKVKFSTRVKTRIVDRWITP
jgi:hypothetical protein